MEKEILELIEEKKYTKLRSLLSEMNPADIAVVLEEVAKMAARTEKINPDVKEAPQELKDKHYYRKHGANAYYGQGK